MCPQIHNGLPVSHSKHVTVFGHKQLSAAASGVDGTRALWLTGVIFATLPATDSLLRFSSALATHSNSSLC
jgi:hypothetical protein